MSIPRIVVAEDDTLVAQDVAETLTELGYRVEAVAHSGEEALYAAAESRADLALMDIRMPGSMDGIEAGKVMARTLGIPVVFLSAFCDEQTVGRALQSTPYGYIRKPFDRHDLHTTLEIALQRRSLERGVNVQPESSSEDLVVRDHLTRLHTERALRAHAESTLKGASQGVRTALVLVDLVDFSGINEALDKGAGDELLRQVGRRLHIRLGPGDMAARLTGDRFGVLFADLAGVKAAHRQGARILDAFADSFRGKGRPIPVHARVAVSVHPDLAADADSLFQRTEQVMEQLKDVQGSVLRMDH